MITRKSLAATIDDLDEQIATLQDSKRDTYISYRAQLDAKGLDKDAIKAEIDAFKLALKRRRAVKEDPKAVEAKDDLVDEIFVEISGSRAARDARVENIDEFRSVRDSDAAAPKANSEMSQHAPAGDATDETGTHSNLKGTNPYGGPVLNSAPAESAPDEISRNDLSPADGPSNAAVPPEAVEAASGLYSNAVGLTPADKLAEEEPRTPEAEQSSSAQPVRTSGKGDRLPVPPPRHVPDLPSFLDRSKMAAKAQSVSENRNEAVS